MPSDADTETLYQGLTHALTNIRRQLEQESDPVEHAEQKPDAIENLGQDGVLVGDVDEHKANTVETTVHSIEESHEVQKNVEEKKSVEKTTDELEDRVEGYIQEEPHPVGNAEEGIENTQDVDGTEMAQAEPEMVENQLDNSLSAVTHDESPVSLAAPAHAVENRTEVSSAGWM